MLSLSLLTTVIYYLLHVQKNDWLNKMSACSHKLPLHIGQRGVTRYAVFSSTTPGPQDHPETDGRLRYNYAFYLPLTVLAWSRLGFGSIVVLVGQESEWIKQNHTRIIYEQLKALNTIIVFLPGSPQNEVMLCQVARLFVPNMAPFRHWNDVILITSDSDLIPLSGNLYKIPKHKEVTIINSECCGTFKHKEKTYKMWPLANIMMSASTWRNVMKYAPYEEKCITHGNTFILGHDFAHSMLSYLLDEFGSLVENPVSKGENDGWFMDQHLCSVRIAQWMEQDLREKLLNFVPRPDITRDRIDRSFWRRNLMRAKEVVDSHLPLWGYREEQWVNMMKPLLFQVFDNSTMRLLEDYRLRMLKD